MPSEIIAFYFKKPLFNIVAFCFSETPVKYILQNFRSR